MSNKTALIIQSALRKSRTDDSLEVTVDPRSRKLGIDWAVNDARIPNAKKADNPTPFPTRSANDQILDMSTLDLSYDQPLDILLTASKAYSESFKAYSDHAKDVERRVMRADSTTRTQASNAVREIGRMLGGEISRAIGGIRTHTVTWADGQKHVDLTTDELKALKRVLPRELFHQALATATECQRRRARWEAVSSIGTGLLVSAARNYIEHFASEGEEPPLRGSLTFLADDYAARRKTVRLSEMATEATCKKHSDSVTFADIYAQVKESTYDQLADGLAVFAQLAQRLIEGVEKKDLVKLLEEGAGESGDASKRFSKIRHHLDALLADELQTEDSNPSSTKSGKVKKQPYYDAPASIKKRTLGRQHFTTLTPSQLGSIVSLSLGDIRTDTGGAFTQVTNLEQDRPSRKGAFRPTRSKMPGTTIQEFRDSLKAEETAPHAAPEYSSEAEAVVKTYGNKSARRGQKKDDYGLPLTEFPAGHRKLKLQRESSNKTSSQSDAVLATEVTDQISPPADGDENKDEGGRPVEAECRRRRMSLERLGE